VCVLSEMKMKMIHKLSLAFIISLQTIGETFYCIINALGYLIIIVLYCITPFYSTEVITK